MSSISLGQYDEYSFRSVYGELDRAWAFTELGFYIDSSVQTFGDEWDSSLNLPSADLPPAVTVERVDSFAQETYFDPRESLEVQPLDEQKSKEQQEQEVYQDVTIRKRSRKSGTYECPLTTCRRKYRRKGDLKTHVKKHHVGLPDLQSLLKTISPPRSTKEGKIYPCPVEKCGCGFMKERGLKRHMIKKHQAEEIDD